MARATTSSLQRGTRIGDYELLAQIARGGFGVVWRGRHVDTDRAVAVKIIRAELIASEELVLRLEREARAIALTRHPNVVELYAFGKLEDGRPYLVMEHVPGVDLDAYLRSRGALPPAEVLSILAPLGDALAAVHAQGIVHRDIKGSNIMLRVRGGSRRVVLLDFGVAKLLEHRGQPITAPRCTVGTPQCMAPEQILGLPVDARTDIYALGVMFYALVTGRLPFDGDTAVEVEEMHLHATPPMPSELAPVSPGFDAVLARALAKRKEQRYPRVQAFLDALRAVARADSRLSAAAVPAPQRVPGIGLLVEVRQADGATASDADLMDEIDDILDRARVAAEATRMRVALDTGNAMLAAVPLPEDVAACAHARALVLDRALELAESLQAQAAPCGLVVAVSVHVDGLDVYGPDADLVGGPLLGLGQWPTQALTRAL